RPPTLKSHSKWLKQPAARFSITGSFVLASPICSSAIQTVTRSRFGMSYPRQSIRRPNQSLPIRPFDEAQDFEQAHDPKSFCLEFIEGSQLRKLSRAGALALALQNS